MVVDLIQSKKFVGLDSHLIQLKLGKETGDYYYNDSNSTYGLTEKGNADWILTFISDENGKIESVIVRKSCCSVTKRIVFASIEALSSTLDTFHH